MFYKFNHNGKERAAKAISQNSIRTVGGVERHSFRIGRIVIWLAASDCAAISREDYRKIERKFERARSLEIAARKAEYLERASCMMN